MAGNANSGKRKDKLWRDALMLSLNRIMDDGSERTKLQALADTTVREGIAGNVQAIKEIGDRVDGKVPQGIVGGDEDDPGIKMIHRIENVIVDPRDPSDTDR